MSEAPNIPAPMLVSERAGNHVALEIRRAILEGRLEPGELLSEEQLARELGTSRTPVREALIELRNEGLVETQANRRAVVRAYDAAELLDVYKLRAALEAHGASVAAERATPDTIRALRTSIERFATLTLGDDIDELVAENLVFHGVIADATGVPRLTKMIDQVMVIPKRYRAYAAYVREHRSAVIRDHVAIADAIARHDPTAAGLLMAEHVRWTGKIAVDAQSS